MNKFINRPTVGIDVSSKFSVVAILSPSGEIYRKPFKIYHTKNGFDYVVCQIKKAEEEFNMKTAIFMESTGVYHLTLFHFLRNKFDTFIINPLITNSNKNSGIRKVKNDKSDALSIAKIGKYQNIKCSSYFEVEMFTLKVLCRDYYKLTDMKSSLKKKLSADLNVVFPGYSSVFTDLSGKTSLEILKRFSSPKAILDFNKEDLIELINKISKHGLKYSKNIYDKLLQAAEEAQYIGIQSYGLHFKITSIISMIETLELQLQNLLKEILSLVESRRLPDNLIKNIKLLQSIPGIGELTAITIMSEIGNIKGFVKAKHLVAYFGIDPSVNQSGKFVGDKNKMSKRGTRIGRRALYAAALASVRKNKKGNPINEVLLKYYKENLKEKNKKLALGAIMHKLIKYIFSVLKNQKPYELRAPQIHKRMYLNNQSKTAA